MPLANNLYFPKYMFALMFLHAKEDNFGKQSKHKKKGMSLHRN